MRLLIADDSALIREGLARLVLDAGHEIIGTAVDADSLTALIDPAPTDPLPTDPLLTDPAPTDPALTDSARPDPARPDPARPDVAILDIRMPPTFTDEGARAAFQLRTRWPDVGILLLSQQVEARYALRLMQEHPHGFGYLLKDRIVELDDLLDAITRVGHGGFAVDPDIVAQLLNRSRAGNVLARLSPREHDILALVAQGLSNRAIGARLRLSAKTVENHVSNLFAKLDLIDDANEHRRIRAVLLYLEHSLDR